MSDAKLLSPDVLEAVILGVSRGDLDAMMALRAHITALAADNAALAQALRRHARRTPCPACGGVGSRLCSTCDNGEVEHYAPEVVALLNAPNPGAALLEQHRRELVRARNAARDAGAERLLSQRDVFRERPTTDGRAPRTRGRRRPAAPHEGARVMSDAAQDLRRMIQTVADGGSRELAHQMERALIALEQGHMADVVHARNEGLELCALGAELRGLKDFATAIRAMMEPEP